MNLDHLLNATANAYRVSVNEIKSPSRIQEIRLARHIFCYIANTYASATYYEIADIVNRDRSTVYVAIEKIKDTLPFYPSLNVKILEILQKAQDKQIDIVINNIDLLKLSQQNTTI